MTKLLILSFHGSKRLPKIRERLEALNLKFKIIYGVDASKKKNISLLKKNYNKKRAEYFLGRKMSYVEMTAPYVHTKAYKYIIKKKIKNCIILEDDIWPSKNLKSWINEKYHNNNPYIIGFSSYDGFVEKKPKFRLFKKYNIHPANTHLIHISAYMVNNNFCKIFLKNTKGKICGISDWPFDLLNNKISSSIALPYPVAVDESNISLLAKNRDKTTPSYKIKRYVPIKIFSFFSFAYYILHIPYLTGRYPNIQFYREHFYKKKIAELRNIIFKNLINTKDIYLNPKFYENDLTKIVKNNYLLRK